MKPILRVSVLLLLACAPSCGLTLLSEQQELKMGLEAYPEETGKFREIKSGRDYQIVNNAMRRLIPYANKDVAKNFSQPFAWEVKLLDAPKIVNAWCLPGGKMAVYSGILPIAKGETGLAVVMSHEIAHAVLRHGNKRMSQNMVLNGLMKAGTLIFSQGATGGEAAGTNNLILKALGLGAQYGAVLPFSRKHESEADAYGLELLVQAGYDPREAVRLWKRMAKLSQRQPEFMSTHPDPLNRARALEAMIPQVLAKYGKTRVGSF